MEFFSFINGYNKTMKKRVLVYCKEIFLSEGFICMWANHVKSSSCPFFFGLSVTRKVLPWYLLELLAGLTLHKSDIMKIIIVLQRFS